MYLEFIDLNLALQLFLKYIVLILKSALILKNGFSLMHLAALQKELLYLCQLANTYWVHLIAVDALWGYSSEQGSRVPKELTV